MASTEREYELASLDKRRRRQRKEEASVWTRGRTIAAQVHGQALTIAIDPNRDMRDPATGKLWFVAGFSRVKATESDPVRPV